MSPPQTPPPTPVQQLRLVIFSVLGSLVLLLVVLLLVGIGPGWVDPLLVAVPLVVGALAVVLLPWLRSRAEAAMPLVADQLTTARALQTRTFTAMAIGEAPALVGFAIAFATESLLPYAVGVVFSVPLLVLYALPKRPA